MDAIKTLLSFKEKFDPLLLEFLDKKITEAEGIDSQAADLTREIKRMAQTGGKRIRPAFMFYAYKASGGKDEEAAIYTSQALELFHTFALIHDDIIDRSDTRRGAPTAHTYFQSLHGKQNLIGDAAHFGLASAILAGDLALSYAHEVFVTSSFSDEAIRTAQRYYNLLWMEVILGEQLDTLGGMKKDVAEKDILTMLALKSGKYTIERPLHIGAALADASDKVFQGFTGYGIPLGQAFQIQDDILGMFGTEEKIGKPVTSDIAEGKKTLLIIKAVEQGNKTQKGIIQKALGNPQVTEQDLEIVKNVVIDAGSLAHSQDLAKKLIEKAKKALSKVVLEKESRDYLLGIADYMLTREY